jgi:hypothetical protein
MTNQTTDPMIELAPDEKLTPAMAYTSHSLVWGQVVSKDAIRISSWLRTDLAPIFMKFVNAQVLPVGGSQNLPPQKVKYLHLKSENIDAFHIMPPATDTPDFDPNEPNRKMVPVIAFVGYFQFSGFIRMAEFNNMDNYLDATKGDFATIYDVTMNCPLMPSIKGVSSKMVILRREQLIFSEVI